MSPELIKAIKERVEAGQAKDVIKASVLAMGHAEAVFEAAYVLALSDLEKSATPAVSIQEPELPSAYELVKDACAFVWRRIDLALFALVPGLLSVALLYAAGKVEGPPALVTGIGIVSAITFIVYLVATFTVIYMASREDTPTYVEGLLWIKRHFFSILWVSILMLLVLFGGFLLLFIPGIILLVSLYFSQYALIIEDQKGVAALARSHALVKGRFVPIALKLLAFMLFLLLPVLIVAAVFAIIVAANPALQKFTLLVDIATELASALYLVVATYAMSRLYRAMQVGRPLTAATTVRKGLYWALALLGVAAVLVAIVAVVFFQTLLPDNVIDNSLPLQTEIQSTSLSAQLYALEHDGSFEGVCDTLRPKITSADPVECNDSDTQWAIMGTKGEERFCADTTTTGKQVNSALGERLVCLILPEKQPLEVPIEASTSTDADTAI